VHMLEFGSLIRLVNDKDDDIMEIASGVVVEN